MDVPTVRLDTTIADLYRKHNISGHLIATVQPVFANVDIHPELPRETVYTEDEEPFLHGESENEIVQLRMLALDLKPIKRVFALGNMDVILFSRSTEHVKQVLNVLPFEQRPNLFFIDLSQGDVLGKLCELTKEKRLLYWSPQEWMRDQDCWNDPDMIYSLNSKEYLIASGIQTPKAELLQVSETNLHIPTLISKELPFVVKLLRASSGYGSWLVTNEDRRRDMLAALSKFVARGGKQAILSAYVKPKLDLSVHLMIGAKGDARDQDNPLIVAVSVQNMTERGHWSGGRIDYSAQQSLKSLVSDTVRRTTRLLPKDFAGWAGIDVVIDEDGHQWVVDLNPRWTGSLPLCLLSRHFHLERGLSHAEFGAFSFEGAIQNVFNVLSPEIRSGKVIVNSLAMVDNQISMADLVWGGKDLEDLIKTSRSIKFRLCQT